MELYGVSECLKLLAQFVVQSGRIISDNQAVVSICNKISDCEDYSKYSFDRIVSIWILSLVYVYNNLSVN